MACELDNPVDVVFRNHRLLGTDYGFLQRLVLAQIKADLIVLTMEARLHNLVHMLVCQARAGHQCGDFLFFLGFPADEVFNIRVVDVDNHHLGCAPRGAA